MKVAVIYVNPIEYHGPHLPLKTDYEISRGLTVRLIQRLQKKIPTLQIVHIEEIHRGCDPAHGPGSEFTSMKDLKKIVTEACDQVVAKANPDLVLFMTFHGAPTHSAAIEAGVQHLQKKNIRTYNPFNLLLTMMRDYNPEWAKPAAMLIEDRAYQQKFIDTLPTDFHGGLFETSVLLGVNSSAMIGDHRFLPDCEDRKIHPLWKLLIRGVRAMGLQKFSRELEIGVDAMGWMKLKSYPGYTGAPRLASEAIGNYFIESVILNQYEDHFYPIIDQKALSPPPIMQWTLGIG